MEDALTYKQDNYFIFYFAFGRVVRDRFYF